MFLILHLRSETKMSLIYSKSKASAQLTSKITGTMLLLTMRNTSVPWKLSNKCIIRLLLTENIYMSNNQVCTHSLLLEHFLWDRGGSAEGKLIIFILIWVDWYIFSEAVAVDLRQLDLTDIGSPVYIHMLSLLKSLFLFLDSDYLTVTR